MKEALEVGGEAYVSQNSEGGKNGLLIYDGYEETGTIFTKSREVFDYFYDLKPSSYIFSELEVAKHPKKFGTSGSWMSTSPQWTTDLSIKLAWTTTSEN